MPKLKVRKNSSNGQLFVTFPKTRIPSLQKSESDPKYVNVTNSSFEFAKKKAKKKLAKKLLRE